MRRVPGEDPNGVAYEPLPIEDGMETSDGRMWRRLREWWARGSDSERAVCATTQPPGPPPHTFHEEGAVVTKGFDDPCWPRGLPSKPPLMIELKSDRNALTGIELVAVRLAERMQIDELGEGLDALCAAWLGPDELTPAQSAIQLTALAAHAIVSARRLAAA